MFCYSSILLMQLQFAYFFRFLKGQTLHRFLNAPILHFYRRILHFKAPLITKFQYRTDFVSQFLNYITGVFASTATSIIAITLHYVDIISLSNSVAASSSTDDPFSLYGIVVGDENNNLFKTILRYFGLTLTLSFSSVE